MELTNNDPETIKATTGFVRKKSMLIFSRRALGHSAFRNIPTARQLIIHNKVSRRRNGLNFFGLLPFFGHAWLWDSEAGNVSSRGIAANQIIEAG